VGLVEVLDDRQGRSLEVEEIALARLLANQAASAIEDARLSEVTRRYMVEATTLNSIGQVITSSLDLHQTLSIIADHAHWLLDVEAASVILLDEERDALWFGAASGESADFVRGQRLSSGQGIVNWVVQHGEPQMVHDASQDPRWFSKWDKETGFVTRSVLCVPLRTKGQTIGAIEAINKASGPFDEKDQTLLTSIASSAAIAIENARLYEELQRRADSLEETVARRTRQLQAERDRTQAILEAVGEAVIVTDLQGKIQYLNPAAVALTGYSFEEVAGQNSRVWQQEQEPTELFAPEPEVLGTSQTQGTEVVSRRKDGTLYDALMTVAPLFDSQGEGRLIGHVCVQRDITPIKEAERLKDQFVSNVSHELRTPLSIITLLGGNLDILYDRLPDEKRQKMIQDIREHAQVLDDLIGDILEISRIEGGRVSMEREPVYLMQLAMEEVEKQRPLAQKKLQDLCVSGAQHLAVWGNREQLRLAVRNLLNNAIKYTPRQGQIACEGAALTRGDATPDWPGSAELGPGRWAALRVTDNGIGISPDDLPQIYDRFFRVKSEGNVSGTGLGLSIAQELIAAHGGKIAAASVFGQGSSFVIYLPLQEE
jgi:NtrC-family two-component system sensor histidine kinase KinB